MHTATNPRDIRQTILDAGLPETDDWETLVVAGHAMGLDLRSAEGQGTDTPDRPDYRQHGFVVIVLDGTGRLSAGNSHSSRLDALADALETRASVPVYRRSRH